MRSVHWGWPRSILARLDMSLAVVMGSVSRSFCIFQADREFEQTWKLPLT